MTFLQFHENIDLYVKLKFNETDKPDREAGKIDLDRSLQAHAPPPPPHYIGTALTPGRVKARVH